jgi:hypothetical protein
MSAPRSTGIEEGFSVKSVEAVKAVPRGRSRIKVVLTAVAGTIGAALITAPAAHASASGCTFAPGGAAAQQCITVLGSGLHVSQVANEYYASPISGNAANVCSRHHQDKFTFPNGNIGYWGNNPSSCILGSVAVISGDYVVWNANQNFYNGRGMCAQSNNSDTGGTWTPFACETIHS